MGKKKSDYSAYIQDANTTNSRTTDSVQTEAYRLPKKCWAG